jgi:hypothetical protein
MVTQLCPRKCSKMAAAGYGAVGFSPSGSNRDNSAPTSDCRGGSAPAREQVMAAQLAANDSARKSSSEFIRASVLVPIRPIARKANNSAA